MISFKNYRTLRDFQTIYKREEHFKKSISLDLNTGNLLKIPKEYLMKYSYDE